MTEQDIRSINEMDFDTFVNIISTIPSCIFFKNREGKYLFSSQRWGQLNSDDIVGKTDLEIRKDTENAIKGMEADKEIIRTKKGCHYTIDCDVDGVINYLELIKEPVINRDGDVIGIVGLINDVTENVLLRNQILEMKKQLEEQCGDLENSNLELQSTLGRLETLHNSHKLFTASMNHELRSPLNGIIGILQLLMDENGLTNRQQESISNAYQSSQYMLKIVNDWLDYAKMETNEFRITNEPFELRESVNNIKYMASNLAKAKDLEFKLNIQEGMADKFFGDETRIYQIMHNFVSNAIKYTAKGSVCLDISHLNNELIITCSDTGQGMSVDSLERIYDPFSRFNEKENAGIEGTGLGMSIVKRIIDQMNGRIDIKSQLGKGTVISAIIPMEEYNETKEIKTEPVREIRYDYSKLNVLCVDDVSVNVTIIKALLKKKGIKSDGAASAKEAIRKTHSKKYDLILMDHQMPDMDGIKAFDTIREGDGINKETPVVMLTGNVDETYEELYSKKGLDGYLTKPVVIDELLKTIDMLCF